MLPPTPKYRQFAFLGLALTSSLSLSSVAAEDAGVATGTELELTTVVTSSRLPQRLKDTVVATEVISRRQIQEIGARTVAEVLQARAGIETFQNVGSTAIRMQGLGPEYNLILIDGQRASGRINGGVDVSRLSVEDIEQIEIVKGPSSVMWGSEALAGTINIITRKGQRTGAGSVLFSYGSLNQIDSQASAEAASGKWAFIINGGYKRRDWFDYDLSTPATNGSALDQGQVAARGSFNAGASTSTSADIHVDFTRRTQVGVDSNESGAVLDRRSRDNILDARGSLRIPVSNGALSTSLGTSLFDRRFIVDQRNAFALDSVEDTLDVNVQLNAQLDHTFFDTHTALFGGEGLIEHIVSPRLVSGAGLRGRGAIFLQDSWTPKTTRPFALVAGVRLDLDSNFGANVSPRLSARFEPHKTLTLRASTGLGYRAPTFQELYLIFENPAVGYVVNGNPALQPERSFGNTLGLEWRPNDRWLFSTSLFWNELWNVITTDVTATGVGLSYLYVNRSRARSRGFELLLSWVTPYKPLTIEVGYTLTDARDLSAAIPLDGQSPHRWLAQLRYRNRDNGVTAQVRLAVTGERPYTLDTTGTMWTRPLAMVDARIAKAFNEHLEIFLAGSNLLNTGNQDDAPIPPVSVFGGLTVRE